MIFFFFNQFKACFTTLLLCLQSMQKIIFPHTGIRSVLLSACLTTSKAATKSPIDKDIKDSY